MPETDPSFAPDPATFDRRWFITRLGAGGIGAAAFGADVLLSGCSSDGEEGHPADGPVVDETHSAEPEKQDKDRPTGEFEPMPTWEMDFSKMGNGTRVDPNKLAPNLNPAVPTWNNEAQAYTNRAENMRVEEGSLVLAARPESYRYPGDNVRYKYTSARLETYDSRAGQPLNEGLTFEYGKMEIVAKLPEGAGVFAAPLWLLSANSPNAAAKVETELAKLGDLSDDERAEKEAKLWGTYYKLDGELDFESYGKPNQVEFTAHTMDTPEQGDEQSVTVEGATDGFHTYAIEVTPDKVTWTVDGKPYHTFEKKSDNPEEWPFGNGNQLYAVTNLAMGGPAGGPIDTSKAPWKLQIQRLSYYPLAA